MRTAVDPPDAAYRTAVAVADLSAAEAGAFLRQQRLPAGLAEQVVGLTGGRLGHLHVAAEYWREASRWLSPMRPGASPDDSAASMAGHSAGAGPRLTRQPLKTPTG